MFKKQTKDFLKKGFEKMSDEVEGFDREHRQISKNIDEFRKDMEEWSKNRRILRNK